MLPEVVNAVKKTVPVVTGYGRSTIHAIADYKGGQSRINGFGVNYLKWVEFGTKYFQGRFFIKRALGNSQFWLQRLSALMKETGI